MEKITLKNPIMIDGKPRSEFNAAPEEITVDQFDKIDALCAAGRKPNEIVMAEFDNVRHRYVAMMAIIAADPSIDIEDLRRIKGTHDIEALRLAGRNFTLGLSEETSTENTSEKQSEHTASDTAQVPSNSAKDA